MAQNNQELHPNWRALATIHIPLKRFIKEGDLTSLPPGTTSRNDKKYQIESESGDKVKQFYEKLTQNSQTIYPPQKPKKSLGQPVRPKEQEESLEKFDKRKLFHYAVSNNLEGMQKMNFNEGDIDECDQYGWSALMMASCEGHHDIVEFLLSKKATRNTKDKSGRTARDLAVKKGFDSIVKLLDSGFVIKLEEEEPPFEDSEEIAPFFCDICQQSFSKTPQKIHLASTIHQFNSKSSDPSNKLQKFNIPQKNRGLQLMVKQGWDKESGLGPEQKGRLYPIKTVLRKDRTGLGIEQDPARVTHFAAFDLRATQRRKDFNSAKKKRSRNDIRSEKIRDWKQNRRLRNALS